MYDHLRCEERFWVMINEIITKGISNESFRELMSCKALSVDEEILYKLLGMLLSELPYTIMVRNRIPYVTNIESVNHLVELCIKHTKETSDLARLYTCMDAIMYFSYSLRPHDMLKLADVLLDAARYVNSDDISKILEEYASRILAEAFARAPDIVEESIEKITKLRYIASGSILCSLLYTGKIYHLEKVIKYYINRYTELGRWIIEFHLVNSIAPILATLGKWNELLDLVKLVASTPKHELKLIIEIIDSLDTEVSKDNPLYKEAHALIKNTDLSEEELLDYVDYNTEAVIRLDLMSRVLSVLNQEDVARRTVIYRRIAQAYIDLGDPLKALNYLGLLPRDPYFYEYILPQLVSKLVEKELSEQAAKILIDELYRVPIDSVNETVIEKFVELLGVIISKYSPVVNEDLRRNVEDFVKKSTAMVYVLEKTEYKASLIARLAGILCNNGLEELCTHTMKVAVEALRSIDSPKSFEAIKAAMMLLDMGVHGDIDGFHFCIAKALLGFKKGLIDEPIGLLRECCRRKDAFRLLIRSYDDILQYVVKAVLDNLENVNTKHVKDLYNVLCGEIGKRRRVSEEALVACTQLQVTENGLNNDSERVVETYSRVFKERVLKGNMSYALEPLLELIWNMLKRKHTSNSSLSVLATLIDALVTLLESTPKHLYDLSVTAYCDKGEAGEITSYSFITDLVVELLKTPLAFKTQQILSAIQKISPLLYRILTAEAMIKALKDTKISTLPRGRETCIQAPWLAETIKLFKAYNNQ